MTSFNPFGSALGFSSENWSINSQDLGPEADRKEAQKLENAAVSEEKMSTAVSLSASISSSMPANESTTRKDAEKPEDLLTSIAPTSTNTSEDDSFTFEIDLPPPVDVSPLSCKESVIGAMMDGEEEIQRQLLSAPPLEIRTTKASKERRKNRARSKSRVRGVAKDPSALHENKSSTHVEEDEGKRARGKSKERGSRSRSVDPSRHSLSKSDRRRSRSKSIARQESKTSVTSKSKMSGDVLAEIRAQVEKKLQMAGESATKSEVEVKQRRERSPSRMRGDRKRDELKVGTSSRRSPSRVRDKSTTRGDRRSPSRARRTRSKSRARTTENSSVTKKSWRETHKEKSSTSRSRSKSRIRSRKSETSETISTTSSISSNLRSGMPAPIPQPDGEASSSPNDQGSDKLPLLVIPPTSPSLQSRKEVAPPSTKLSINTESSRNTSKSSKDSSSRASKERRRTRSRSTARHSQGDRSSKWGNLDKIENLKMPEDSTAHQRWTSSTATADQEMVWPSSFTKRRDSSSVTESMRSNRTSDILLSPGTAAKAGLVKVKPKLKPVMIRTKSTASDRSISSQSVNSTPAYPPKIPNAQSKKGPPMVHTSGSANVCQSSPFKARDFNSVLSKMRAKKKLDSAKAFEEEAATIHSRDSFLSPTKASKPITPKMTPVILSRPSSAPSGNRKKVAESLAAISSPGASIEEKLINANDLIKRQKLKKANSISRQKSLEEFGVGSFSSPVDENESEEIFSMAESIDSAPSRGSWGALKGTKSSKKNRSTSSKPSEQSGTASSKWAGLKGTNQFILATKSRVDSKRDGRQVPKSTTDPGDKHLHSNFSIPEETPMENSMNSSDDFTSTLSKSPGRRWSPKKLSQWAARKGHEIAASTGRASDHKRLLLDDEF